MEGHGRDHSGSPGLLPKKNRTLNLQKCDFCRKRKVGCEPKNRRWPDKCDHCERRGEDCSPPGFATRRPRTRQTSDLTRPTSPSHQRITEVSVPLPRGEPPDPGGNDVTLTGTVLTYQQVKDIITVLRCLHAEYHVEMSQSRWLEREFRNISLEIDMNQFSEKVASRRRSLSWLQTRTLHRVKSTLYSHNHSPAERMLICQLLVDLETCSSPVVSDSKNLEHQGNAFDVSYKQDLADLLIEAGDYNGALALLHRIPITHIRKHDLNKLTLLGVALCSRMKMIPEILGTDGDPMELDVFEHMQVDVLVLPYSLLAVCSSERIENEDIIKKSFLWPWIRRSIEAQLKDQPGAPLDWQPTTLDPYLQDAFGHSFLHAATYSEDTEDVIAIMDKTLELGQGIVRACLSTTWPTYAPGFTPLACSASPFGGSRIFDSADWKFIDALPVCVGSLPFRTGHRFCALAFAIRNFEIDVVRTLIQRSIQQNSDISYCCRWALSWIPNIPRDISGHLPEAGQQHKRRPLEVVEVLGQYLAAQNHLPSLQDCSARLTNC